MIGGQTNIYTRLFVEVWVYVGRNYFCKKKKWFRIVISYACPLQFTLSIWKVDLEWIQPKLVLYLKALTLMSRTILKLSLKDSFRINLRTNSFFKIQDLQHKVLRRILLCPFHFIAHWLKEYVNKCVLMTWVRQYATLSEQAQKYST